MSSNTKEIKTKGAMKSESMKSGSSGVKVKNMQAQALATHKKEIPGYLNEKMKVRVGKVSNNSGFKLRPENKMIMKGDLSAVDPGNPLFPFGFNKSDKGK